jgi:hypothetical protein
MAAAVLRRDNTRCAEACEDFRRNVRRWLGRVERVGRRLQGLFDFPIQRIRQSIVRIVNFLEVLLIHWAPIRAMCAGIPQLIGGKMASP